MQRSTRVVVIGAGIGGLTAAAALHQRGFEVRVYERASELGEVGAGLQLGPNAVKVVRALGIEEAVAAVAFEPVSMVSLRWDDASLRYRERVKGFMSDRFAAPYLMAHRADLHRTLLDLLPEGSVATGAACTSATSEGRSAVAQLGDGTEIEADVIVGADGIHSAVRDSLFGTMPARFTHQICWRAMVPIEELPTRVGPNLSVELDRSEYVGWLGPNGHVLCYPIKRGEVLNIFAGRVSEQWVEESWSVPSSPGEMIAAYEGWNEALLEIFRKVGHCYKWGIYDRDPLPQWTKRRVTLVGDAAHPMMPTLAQGAAIAMEDGIALARALANDPDDMERALQSYEGERRPRASRVQLQARTQFENNRKNPPPPPLSRDWIFAHDAATGLDIGNGPHVDEGSGLRG